MPDSLENHIENIRIKVNLLIKSYHVLLEESRRLQNENEKLKSSNLELKEMAANLEQQNQILKASAGKMEGEEKKAFEKVINEYIKDIDKCMTMLNK